MICPSCGKEFGEGKKFCPVCGAALGESTTVMPQAAAPQAPVPTQPTTPLPAVTPGVEAPGAKQGSRRAWVILAAVLGVLIIGGAVAGIVIWVVSSSGKPIAKIESLALTRKDGKKLDLEKVPLDKGLSLDVAFTARYKEGGSGNLRVSVEDSNGDEIISDSWNVKSSDTLQKKSFVYTMTESDGKPLKAIADLKVKTDGEELSDTGTLAYTAVKGQGKASSLDEAKKAALEKLKEADAAVQELTAAGIDASDLAEQVADLEVELKNASTVEEANTIFEAADAVIGECNARKASQGSEEQSKEICRANQATIRSAIEAFANAEGNYPDSMDMLVTQGYLDAMPKCPSGGSYTYNVDYAVTPETLTVSCSVHGSL